MVSYEWLQLAQTVLPPRGPLLPPPWPPQVVVKSQILAGGRGLGKFTNGLQVQRLLLLLRLLLPPLLLPGQAMWLRMGLQALA